MVRRSVVREGLLLYQSRGLVEQRFGDTGVLFAATERSGAFLDTLGADYVLNLRERAAWLVDSFGDMPEANLERIVSERLGEWGAEFNLESVLWAEESLR